MLGARDDEHGAVLRSCERRDEELEADRKRKGLVRLLASERHELHRCRRAGEDVAVPRDKTIGLLLTRGAGGVWLASACSVVDPGLLVAEGGQPRGGLIKVALGIVVLALVLLWALRRLRKGARPDLPGAPRP